MTRVHKCTLSGIAVTIVAVTSYIPPDWQWVAHVLSIAMGGVAVLQPRPRNERASDTAFTNDSEV
jgi:hypothetical protein